MRATNSLNKGKINNNSGFERSYIIAVANEYEKINKSNIILYIMGGGRSAVTVRLRLEAWLAQVNQTFLASYCPKHAYKTNVRRRFNEKCDYTCFRVLG